MKFFEAEAKDPLPDDDTGMEASPPPAEGGMDDPSQQDQPVPTEPVVVKSVDVWDILKKYLDKFADTIGHDDKPQQQPNPAGVRPARPPAQELRITP